MTPFELISFLLTLAALVLSVVALIVTGVGFFASLFFYQRGMEAQQRVGDLLTKVEAKVESISTQVGGLFETTLKAALNRPGEQVQAQTREASSTAEEDNPLALLDAEFRKDEVPGATLGRLFLLRGLRFTNVSDPVGQLFFGIGRDQAFNLFDRGGQSPMYYGHFYKLEGVEIVKRVRILIGRLHDMLVSLLRAPEEPRRDLLLSLLRSTRVEVLVPSSISIERFQAKLAEFQPEDWKVPVKFMTPDDLEREYREELEDMEP